MKKQMIYKNGLLQNDEDINLAELFGKKDSHGNITLTFPLHGSNVNYIDIGNTMFVTIDDDSKINNLNKWGKLKCNGLKCLEE